MLELLFVIAIIVGLAAFMAGALGPAKKRIARSRTQGLMEMLKSGLEQYHATYGVYPLNDDLEEGGKVLYRSLYGDYNDDGDPDWLGDTSGDAGDLKTFVNDLQPPEMNQQGEPIGNKVYVSRARGFYEVVDAWGEPIYYINYKPGEHSDAPEGGGKHNSNYDLWSLGNDPDPSDDNNSMWIKNW